MNGAGIFVVDDDRDIRRAVIDALEEEGYRVREASNGREALERLRSTPDDLPCLILLDIMMPVMDGWQFRREQLKDPKLAEIPVVLLTADLDAAQKASQMNARSALPKPVTLDALLAAVQPYCA